MMGKLGLSLLNSNNG